MNEGQMIAEFEAWWKQELLVNLKMDIQEITKYLEKTSQGEYTHAATLMRWKVWKAAIASQEDDLQFLFDEVKTLCQIICNSLPDTPIRGEIQSRAFMIGHYPDVLNANRNLSADLQPTIDREREKSRLVETIAKSIYEQWSDKDGYVPWVEGGNSDMQYEARRQAIASMSGEQK